MRHQCDRCLKFKNTTNDLTVNFRGLRICYREYCNDCYNRIYRTFSKIAKLEDSGFL